MRKQLVRYARFSILLFVSCFVISIIWSFVNRNILRSNAAQPLVDATLTPKTLDNIGIGQTMQTTYFIHAQDAGNKISTITMRLLAGGDLAIKDVTAFVPGDPSNNLTQINKTVTDSQADFAYSANVPQNPAPIAISVQVTYILNLSGKNQTSTGTLSIDTANSVITGNISGNYDWGIVDQGTYSSGGSQDTRLYNMNATGNSTQSGQVKLSFIPIDPTKTTIDITLNDIGLNDQPAYVLRGTCAAPGAVAYTLNTIQNGTSTTSIKAYMSDLVDNNYIVAVEKSAADTQYTSCGNLVSANLYTGSITPTPTVINPTPTVVNNPTPTTTVTGDTTIDLKLKFQGITSGLLAGVNGFEHPTSVRLVNVSDPAVTHTFTIIPTATNNGVMTAAITFNMADENLTAGTYFVYIKGPKHLQKKICAAHPTETTPGSYHCTGNTSTIPIQPNVNGQPTVLDFSDIYQTVGDIPDDNGQQDGIVDSYDIGFLRNHLGSTAPADLIKGDLNMDGRIDTQDYSLLIQSLSIKYDDQ